MTKTHLLSLIILLLLLTTKAAASSPIYGFNAGIELDVDTWGQAT